MTLWTNIPLERISPDETFDYSAAEALDLATSCAEESRRILNEQAALREGNNYDEGAGKQAATLAALAQAYAMIACGRLA